MTNAPHRRRFAPLVAATALLAAMAMLVGCYHPHHYRHHSRHGGYDYDHRDRHGDWDRRDRDRHHDRRGDRHGGRR